MRDCVKSKHPFGDVRSQNPKFENWPDQWFPPAVGKSLIGHVEMVESACIANMPQYMYAMLLREEETGKRFSIWIYPYSDLFRQIEIKKPKIGDRVCLTYLRKVMLSQYYDLKVSK